MIKKNRKEGQKYEGNEKLKKDTKSGHQKKLGVTL